ncbi:MAG: quinol:cytochrome C oxidoreductase [Chitinophagaceae bacterium]|nr:quinol:cytochrome C oxidoreductase [Chitinophagaceae bacterium]
MTTSKEFFEVPKRYKNWSYGLIGIGILALLVGYFMYGASDDIHHKSRFWATLLQNSTYFLLTTNAAMFFICATILAFGGWQMVFRRVPEAISAAVPVIGVITLVILLAIVFGGHHMTHIYHWTDHETVANDKILEGKSPFLNIPFYIIWTVLIIGLWSLLGFKVRKISLEADKPMSVEQGKKYIWKNTVWASLYIVWFALTVMSTTPWLWLMSIDAHWYSTMYSWYTFASTWVSGLALITLFVIYLKNAGYLEYTNKEHLHDLGKFMFAFSIFWAYLWFSQFMLIWYANIPEETVYFNPRIKDGAYSGVFWFNFIINFLAPFLIFMKRNSKRNYTTVTIMSLIIVFGHWLDFYQMVMASVAPDHVEMNLFDFGIALGFVGIIMLVTGRALSKYPLVSKYHPFQKESIIHHT